MACVLGLMTLLIFLTKFVEDIQLTKCWYANAYGIFLRFASYQQRRWVSWLAFGRAVESEFSHMRKYKTYDYRNLQTNKIAQPTRTHTRTHARAHKHTRTHAHKHINKYMHNNNTYTRTQVHHGGPTTSTQSNIILDVSLSAMSTALTKAGYEVYATDSTNSQVVGSSLKRIPFFRI